MLNTKGYERVATSAQSRVNSEILKQSAANDNGQVPFVL